MGRTRKPCPGCGQTEYTRETDKVCRACQRLLDEAKAAREKAARQRSCKLYVYWQYGYYEGRSYSDGQGGGFFHGQGEETKASPRYVLEWYFEKLIAELSAVGIAQPTYEQRQKAGRLFPHVVKPDSNREQRAVWLTEEQALCLRWIDWSIRQALENASAAGERHGSNILVGLAEGTLSIADFNKISLGGYK